MNSCREPGAWHHELSWIARAHGGSVREENQRSGNLHVKSISTADIILEVLMSDFSESNQRIKNM